LQEKYELIIINQNVIIYMNEATELLKRIFSEEKNTVHYCGEADLVEKLSDALYNGDIVDFESPDIYIKHDKTVWIIEHFEFDCYQRKSKGSTYKIEKSRIDRNYENIIPTTEGVSINDRINAESSYEDYIKNVNVSFCTHYDKVNNYKRHIIDKEAFDGKVNFKTIFLIEDVSPVGSSCIDNYEKWIPIELALSKEFLEMLKASPLVDGVLAISCINNRKRVWFIDRDHVDDYILNAEDYVHYRFMNSKPHVVGFMKLLE